MAKPDQHWQDYLSCREEQQRLNILANKSKQGITLPISLAEDLLELELSDTEKLAIIEAAHSDDSFALEHFLTANLDRWPQDLAARAIRRWHQDTHHFLWFRFLPLATANIPQRVRYTLLDICQSAGGLHLIKEICSYDGLDELSDTFKSLLFSRCLQWDHLSERVCSLALTACDRLLHSPFASERSLTAAATYLARFKPKELERFCSQLNPSSPWKDLLQVMLHDCQAWPKASDKLARFLEKPPKTKRREKLQRLWAASWNRHYLTADIIGKTYEMFASDKEFTESNTQPTWEIFAGTKQKELVESIATIADPRICVQAINEFGALLPCPDDEKILATVRDCLSKTDHPEQVLDNLSLRFRLHLTAQQSQETNNRLTTTFNRAKKEEEAFLARKKGHKVIYSDYMDPDKLETAYFSKWEDNDQLTQRKQFFNLAYKQHPPHTKTEQSFWTYLIDSWLEPHEDKLQDLAAAARKETGVFRLCYIGTLGRYKGIDQAALKLLDFVRATQEDELRAVIRAFEGIDTARANQELIAAITRPNTTLALQIEIAQILQGKNVDNLQKEIRSAINDLKMTHTNPHEGHIELEETLTGLIKPQQSDSLATTDAGDTPIENQLTGALDANLNALLAGKIPHFKELSSEVKRALRTSQFFDTQVSASKDVDSIDLSPVIDMQYKSLELLFREVFEEYATQIIHSGLLQRRLDVIGYARPVPAQMDTFENYIKSLSVIRDIPFFSKFKLRKMLRAISQFRPGKRFTLDGLKAFGLFFLCFGRIQCSYGLKGLLQLGFATDEELFQFVKTLHVMQDFRNRAAHEGFHPDASNDISGIWRSTAEIIQTVFKIKTVLESAPVAAQGYSAHSRQPAPVIERKKVS